MSSLPDAPTLRRLPNGLFFAVLVVLGAPGAGCGDGTPELDAGADALADSAADSAASRDAGADSGPAIDAGTRIDAGTGCTADSVPPSGPPAIASVSEVARTLLIEGEGFGRKDEAAPHFFQPFAAVGDGEGWAGAGLDFAAPSDGTYIYTGPDHVFVNNSEGVGGGALQLNYPAVGGERFTHHGVFLPAETSNAYVSYWVRVRQVTSNPIVETMQFKGIRVGHVVDRGDPVGGMYRGPFSLGFSMFRGEAGLWDPLMTVPNRLGNDGEFYSEPPGTPFVDGEWHFLELYSTLNQVGESTGSSRVLVDGRERIAVHDLPLRQAGDEAHSLGYVQFSPGLANGFAGNDWEVFQSRYYVDTTESQVFLCEAAERSACGAKFLLAPTEWCGTRVTIATGDAPDGFDYLYVTNELGESNAVGYVL